MKNKTLMYILLGLVLISIVLIYFFTGSESNIKKYESSDWYRSYNVKDDRPFGLKIFYDLLDSANAENDVHLIGRQDLSRVLKTENPNEHDLYIFIGKEQYLNGKDQKAISNFVERGNSVLCVNNSADKNPLLENVTYSNIKKIGSTDSVIFNLNINERKKNKYTIPYIYNAYVVNHSWSYFNYSKQSEERTELGEIEQKNNYFKIEAQYGYGGYYFHSNPYVFTNVAILYTQNGVQYIEDVISFLPKGDIFWDEHTKRLSNNYSRAPQSAMQFILKNPPLLWAYGLFLTGLLLHLIFNSKRKRRKISGIESNTNHSKEFVSTIAEIYYNAQKPEKWITLKEKTFLAFLNRKYFLNYNKIDEEHIKEISQKSEIPEEKVEALINQFIRLLSKPHLVNNRDVISLNDKIEYFYQNCK